MYELAIYAGSDYEPRSNFPVIFPAGALATTVRISILDDGITERLESFLILLSSASSSVIITSGEESTNVTIVDTDSKQLPRFILDTDNRQ